MRLFVKLPKLIAEDVPLFNALNSDFFPGLEIPPTDYGAFKKAIETTIDARLLQRQQVQILKMCVCVSVCLSVCLSVCVCVYVYICIYRWESSRLFRPTK